MSAVQLASCTATPNPALLPLASLLTHGRAAEQAVFYDAQGCVVWAAFATQVKQRAAYLAQHSAARWLLVCAETGEFSIWLMALLAAGKQIVMPANAQAGTRELLADYYDACVDEVDLNKLPVSVGTPPEFFHRARLDLFTSGSSGSPKCVSKTLQQLDNEVAALESLWGESLGNARVLATVPHQHIYGLLFRVLWPLAAGRAFDTVVCAHPDTLQQRLALAGRNSVLIASPAHLSRLPDLLDLMTVPLWPQQIFSSGGALATEVAATFLAQTGAAPTEVYGSTETGGIAWRCQTDSDAAWTLLPGVRLALAAHGQERQARLHSPFLPADSEHYLDDGIALESSGRFRLLGRLDRIVKVEEKRLSLPDMEDRVRTHPWVSDAAAVLLSGARQSVGLAITLSNGGQAALTQQGRRHIGATLRHYLADYFDAVLLPRYWRYVDTLPYNAQGKLPQAAVLGLFESEGGDE